MRLFSRKSAGLAEPPAPLSHPISVQMSTPDASATRKNVHRLTKTFGGDFTSHRSRTNLYRFLAAEIPAIQACIATWVRMSTATGKFQADWTNPGAEKDALLRLDNLSARLGTGRPNHSGNLTSFLTELFRCLYRDGAFAGFLHVRKDASRVEDFIPIDTAAIVLDSSEDIPRLFMETDERLILLDSPDFYHLTHNAETSRPLGSSILQTIPFVAYIQQQLVDDMRRTSHNAGFHRLHVKVTPPERVSGESDKAYIDRINSYFDSTVSMIKSCRIDENPVTWDNVAIDHIGPENVRAVTNSWFMNHRAMIEEICAGTNLAPFMLGYSYGATSTWSSFKFDLVMRHVRSVQSEVAAFLEWIGNVELALAGIPARCRFEFDNTYAYQAQDASSIKAREVDNLLRLFEAGLIDEPTAREKAGLLTQ